MRLGAPTRCRRGFGCFAGWMKSPADFGPSALTIGNFDGVHAGHRRILRRVREIADEYGWKASVLTFDPHPMKSRRAGSRAAVDDLAGAALRSHARRGD